MTQHQMRIRMATHMALILTATVLMPASGLAGDWPQFRGPNNSGIADDSRAPTEWTATKNLAWKQSVPGYGWSSPIVVGDKILLTTAITEKQERPKSFNFGGPPGGGFGPPGGRPPAGGPPPGGRPPGGFGGFGSSKPPDAMYRWEIHCLDRHTGQKLWSQVALERKPAIAAMAGNTYASETPVSDGQRVYAYFGMHGLYCYDLDGKPHWHKELGAFPMRMGFGTGSSPAIDSGRVYVLCDNEEKSFLIALDAVTGDELWKELREEKSNWTTPFVWRNKLRTEIVAAGGKSIRSYDPSSGKVLWELKREETGEPSSATATPVADEAMLYVGVGSRSGNSPLWAIRAGAEGDITLKEEETTNKHVAWTNTKAGPPLSSPLLYRDHLYVLAQNLSILSCYDAKTGKEVYKQRLAGAKSFTSSPWAIDDKVYCLDQDGQTFVVRAGPKFELLGRNSLDQDMFWATPAVIADALYLRGADHVYCIRP